MTRLALGPGLTGCIALSDLAMVGRTGVVCVEGDLAIVWDSCREAEVRSVVMVTDREELADDEENPEVGRWEMGERNREEKISSRPRPTTLPASTPPGLHRAGRAAPDVNPRAPDM